ncbi:MAG: ABC transporter ATP-binding protein [Pleomorphochaeta sp.]
MSIVKMSNVSFSYKNKEILNNVSFEIKRGETFGLVGNSGSGKSTIALLLLKLVGDYTGSIKIEDKELREIKKRKDLKNFYRNVQIVFQDPYSSLDSKKTVGYLIEEPLTIHKIGLKKEREEKVNNIMKLVGLDLKYKTSYPHQLSGGLRQRLAIAIALILEPKIIVLDECVSALDISIQAGVLNLLNELKRELNLTFLFISHDLNVVGYICDRIGVINDGKIIEIQETTKLFKNPIDSYTKKLFNNSYY